MPNHLKTETIQDSIDSREGVPGERPSRSNGAKPKPLWKLKDAELLALANSDDPRADRAWDELSERGRERIYGIDTPEDTPCLEAPWWAER